VIAVALLGAGFMGSTHAVGWQALGERARVRTVCSRTPERGEKLAESLGAEFSADLDAVLSDPGIDVVDVCLPTGLHRPVTERALAAGKHVLLEKPIALTLDDADAIVRAAGTSEALLMVAHVLNFFPAYEEILRRLRAGELGKPLSATAYRLSAPADWNTWMQDEAQSGGTAVDDMVHDFDQTNLLFGTPQRVYARRAPAAPLHVQAIVTYDGAEVVVEGSGAMPLSYPFSAGLRVVCERGVAEHGFRAFASDEGNIGEQSEDWLRVYPAGGEPEDVKLDEVDPWAVQIAYFAECIESGRSPERGTPEQAHEALRVSLAAVRSLRSGRPEEA
jgi:predicted dehydrogenase